VDGRDEPGHDVPLVIPGERSEGRGSTTTLSAVDFLPLRCASAGNDTFRFYPFLSASQIPPSTSVRPMA